MPFAPSDWCRHHYRLITNSWGVYCLVLFSPSSLSLSLSLSLSRSHTFWPHLQHHTRIRVSLSFDHLIGRRHKKKKKRWNISIGDQKIFSSYSYTFIHSYIDCPLRFLSCMVFNKFIVINILKFLCSIENECALALLIIKRWKCIKAFTNMEQQP